MTRHDAALKDRLANQYSAAILLAHYESLHGEEL